MAEPAIKAPLVGLHGVTVDEKARKVRIATWGGDDVTLPWEWFIKKRGALGPSPDFLDAHVVDLGQTLRLGAYRISARDIINHGGIATAEPKKELDIMATTEVKAAPVKTKKKYAPRLDSRPDKEAIESRAISLLRQGWNMTAISKKLKLPVGTVGLIAKRNQIVPSGSRKMDIYRQEESLQPQAMPAPAPKTKASGNVATALYQALLPFVAQSAGLPGDVAMSLGALMAILPQHMRGAP